MKLCAKFFLLCIFAIYLLGCSSSTTVQNPEAAKYNTQLGLAYLQQGDISRAKEKLLLATRQAPKDPLALEAMGYFFDITQQTVEAEKYYQMALKLAPKDGTVQNNYGGHLCRQQLYHEAINYFLLAAADINYLSTATAYENAGLCALQIPDYKLAKLYLERALAIDPKLASARQILKNIPAS